MGTICVRYTGKPGRFSPGSSFVPVSGTIQTLGGTGSGARWSGGGKFNQTALTGASVEHYGFSAGAHAAIAKAKRMTSACKRVAAIHH